MTSRLKLIVTALILIFGVHATASAQPVSTPSVDPEAETVLRRMSDFLKAKPAAVFRVSDTIDEVQEDGRKLQFAHVREIMLVRPNRLKMVTMGDVTNRTLWLSEKTLTVLDRDENVYAQIDAPGTIDETVTLLQEKYGMSLPGADLLSENVYPILVEGCSSIEYVGMSLVGEEPSHHLAFQRDLIDYQLWVAAGDQPGPRKMVITYKRLPGEPQYTMQLLKTEPTDKIDGNEFNAELPKDADQIGFHPKELTSDANGGTKP